MEKFYVWIAAFISNAKLILKQELWNFFSPWMRFSELSYGRHRSALHQQIATQQFTKYVEALTAGWFISLGAHLLWVVVIWPLSANKKFLVGWLACAMLLFSHRIYHQIVGTQFSLRELEQQIGRMAQSLGVLLGFSGYALPYDSAQYDHLFILVLIMMNTAALSITANYPAARLWYSLPSLVLGIPFLLRHGTFLSTFLVIGVLLTLAEIYRLTRSAGQTIEAALITAEEKKQLLIEIEKRQLEAQVANQAKTRFLTAASHDLRQPINSISLLLAAQLDEQNAAQSPFLERMHTSIQNMDQLLNAITEAANLDAGTVAIQIEAVSLAHLFKRLQTQFQAEAHAKNIRLEFKHAEHHALTDAFQLHRILTNFISNAIRYGKLGGRVVVRSKVQQNNISIQVWDNGIGIPKQERARIFEEFYQVGIASEKYKHRKRQGLGLGLYIVRRIAARLNHKIRLHSRYGQGSLFAIEIPIAQPSAKNFITAGYSTDQYRTALTELKALLSGLLVLIVEDDAVVMADIQLFLKKMGCQFIVGTCLSDARSVVAETLRTPDLIISDYRLANRELGTDVIQAIRSDINEAIPALFITAEYLATEQDKSKFHGMPVLTKPLNLIELLSVLNNLLHKKNPPG